MNGLFLRFTSRLRIDNGSQHWAPKTGNSALRQVVRKELSPLSQQPPRMTFNVPLSGPRIWLGLRL